MLVNVNGWGGGGGGGSKGAEGTDGFKQVLPSDADRLLELILLHLKLFGTC